MSEAVFFQQEPQHFRSVHFIFQLCCLPTQLTNVKSLFDHNLCKGYVPIITEQKPEDHCQVKSIC